MDINAIEVYKDVLSGTRKRFPQNFWKDDENQNFSDAATITRYLLEDILKWNDEDIKVQLCCKVFFEHKLKGMLCVVFKDSVYSALDNAYPGKFRQWELSCTPRNFWNLKTAKEATIWMYKEKLQWSDEKIKENVSRQLFVENGLDTMLHVLFGNNATKAISNAFPELF